MKIIRNGQEFELTPEEMSQAYYEMDEYYRQQDIIQQADCDGIQLNECEIEQISKIAQRMLENHTYYMDIYWGAIEDAIYKHTNKEE